jgi:hypothetical protein
MVKMFVCFALIFISTFTNAQFLVKYSLEKYPINKIVWLYPEKDQELKKFLEYCRDTFWTVSDISLSFQTFEQVKYNELADNGVYYAYFEYQERFNYAPVPRLILAKRIYEGNIRSMSEKSAELYRAFFFHLDEEITNADILLSIRLMNDNFKERRKSNKKNCGYKLLKNELLIDETFLSEQDKKKLPDIYPGKYKFVSHAAIDSAIIQQKANTSIIYRGQYLWSNGGILPTWAVYDTQTGRLVSDGAQNFSAGGSNQQLSISVIKQILKHAKRSAKIESKQK